MKNDPLTRIVHCSQLIASKIHCRARLRRVHVGNVVGRLINLRIDHVDGVTLLVPKIGTNVLLVAFNWSFALSRLSTIKRASWNLW